MSVSLRRALAAQRSSHPTQLSAPDAIPLGFADELEWADAAPRRFRTLLLRNGRCPYGCVFCALPSRGLDRPLPRPAALQQLAAVLAAAPADLWGLKLYNGSSFFESSSLLPAARRALLVGALWRCRRVVVESRPEFAAAAERAARRFGDRLELALGLEVADDRWLARLGKRTTAGAYFALADRVAAAGALVRAFVLLGMPHASAGESLDLCLRTLERCAAEGIGSVTILPTAATTPAMRRWAARGRFRPPTMRALWSAARFAIDRGLTTRIDLSFHDPPLGCSTCRAACAELNASGRLWQPDCTCST